MPFEDYIKQRPAVKQFVHRMLIPKNEHRPRLWVRWFLNPLKHKRGKNSIVRRFARMDVLPFNHFELGAYSVIEDFATINNGVGEVRIGDQVTVGIGSVVIGPVNIGNDVIIAQHVVISGLNHIYEDVNQPIRTQSVTVSPITIEAEAWIGANSVITAGVTIGKHSIVGAGAIVTKDVPPYSIVVGNPARVVKAYDEKQQAWVKA